MKIKYYAYIKQDENDNHIICIPDVNIETSGATLVEAIQNAEVLLNRYVGHFFHLDQVGFLPEASNAEYAFHTWLEDGDSLVTIETDEIT